MANNGQLHLFIGKGQAGETKAHDQSQPKVENTEMEGSSFEKQAIFSALVQSGQQAISQSINFYGQITGDMTTVRAINIITNLSADVLTIAKGGVVGAIAVGTKYGLQAIGSGIETYNTNRQIQVNNQLLGTISTKGSRYW